MADFEMYAGDSKTLQVTVLDDAGAAADISGATVRWQMARYCGATPVVEKATGSGISIVDGPTGRFDVALLPADTEALQGCHYHEAELENVGVVSTVLTGEAHIKPTTIKPAA